MVNIKINKSNKCNGDYSLFISFPYDQFIVNIMRGLSIRYWHPDSKEWETPLKNLDDIKRSLNNYMLFSQKSFPNTNSKNQTEFEKSCIC